MGREEREEIKKKKGTDNLFNKILKTSLTLKKRTFRCKKFTEHQTIRTKKETHKHIIIKTLNIQNKERILKAAKEKKQVTYKDKPN
jgi:hypothetical protein